MIILAQIINAVYWIVVIALWARIILSFVRPDPYHPTWGPILRMVHDVTEPMLAPVRRIIPPMGMMDFSPLIVFLIVGLLRTLLFGILF